MHNDDSPTPKETYVNTKKIENEVTQIRKRVSKIQQYGLAFAFDFGLAIFAACLDQLFSGGWLCIGDTAKFIIWLCLCVLGIVPFIAIAGVYLDGIQGVNRKERKRIEIRKLLDSYIADAFRALDHAVIAVDNAKSSRAPSSRTRYSIEAYSCIESAFDSIGLILEAVKDKKKANNIRYDYPLSESIHNLVNCTDKCIETVETGIQSCNPENIFQVSKQYHACTKKYSQTKDELSKAIATQIC